MPWENAPDQSSHWSCQQHVYTEEPRFLQAGNILVLSINMSVAEVNRGYPELTEAKLSADSRLSRHPR